jgi:PhzF family phenazine biosynthesis protein
MNIPIYQVDAFTRRAFRGNPAAVCPLDSWLPDELLQQIAAENNLSETAYFVRERQSYRLRWFTPATEVDLCGHATLASAFVIFEQIGRLEALIRFETRSGALFVTREDGLLVMDFPSRPAAPHAPHPNLVKALGRIPVAVLSVPRDYLAVYATEDDVRALDPDMQLLSALDKVAVIVTAPGSDCDFVSRFFAPVHGVPEDPVTGSAHCTLAPYWAAVLGKNVLFARQVSRRGGEIRCRLRGDRVELSGQAVLVLTGTLHVPD